MNRNESNPCRFPDYCVDLCRLQSLHLALSLGLALPDAEAEQAPQVGNGGLGLALAFEADVGEPNGALLGLTVLREVTDNFGVTANYRVDLRQVISLMCCTPPS